MRLDEQFYLLIHTLLFGVFLGIALDTVSHFLQKIKRRGLLSGVLVLFWTLQIPLAVLFFHRVNQGRFQSYLLVFVIIGGLFYFKVLQKKYLKDLKILLSNCHQCIKWLKKIINTVIFLPMGFIFAFISDIIMLPKKFLRAMKVKQLAKDGKQIGDVQSH